MRLIIGLGNPGKAYANSRHNIGFRCINRLARVHGISLAQRGCQAQFGIGQIASAEIVLAKPRTFMNLSGKSVGSLKRRFQTPLSDILVIHDDLDLPLGKLRFYSGGGSGGHKGIESIVSEVGSRDFPRLRVGIGRPQEDEDATAYVLGDFSSEERVVIDDTVATVTEAILCYLREGIVAAMNRYN